jgi:pyrrolidone-carboxylate peptidase
MAIEHSSITSRFLLLFLMILMPQNANSLEGVDKSNIEDARVSKAQIILPEIVTRYQGLQSGFRQNYTIADNELAITQDAATYGKRLWQQAVRDVQSGYIDDRPLYWGRLVMRNIINEQKAGFSILPWQRGILLRSLELASRGISDINFDSENNINILLTGFDPFFLDKDIQQSNPSGVVALALDGQRFTVNGRQAQIETVMIPVRYQDFDNGIIESILTPLFRRRQVAMVFTVSMGREGFDLERFPGLNRSAAAPDNVNHVTGATQSQPHAPLFNGKPLMGPEFVEFSLPVEAMKAVSGPWPINDNHQVSTLKRGQFEAASLAELRNETSVEGSGGGYLSNEISYRSILLKQQFNLDIPVGHIHTPKVSGHNAKVEQDIIEQVNAMVKAAASKVQ